MHFGSLQKQILFNLEVKSIIIWLDQLSRITCQGIHRQILAVLFSRKKLTNLSSSTNLSATVFYRAISFFDYDGLVQY